MSREEVAHTVTLHNLFVSQHDGIRNAKFCDDRLYNLRPSYGRSPTQSFIFAAVKPSPRHPAVFSGGLAKGLAGALT